MPSVLTTTLLMTTVKTLNVAEAQRLIRRSPSEVLAHQVRPTSHPNALKGTFPPFLIQHIQR